MNYQNLMFNKYLPLLYNKLSDENIIKKIIDWADIYYDEPKIFIYNTICSKKIGIFNEKAFIYSGVGSSFFSRHLALLKSLAETAERVSLLKFDPAKITFANQKDLVSTSVNLKPYKTNVNNITLGWVKGRNLTVEEEGFVPAQLFYPNYYEYGNFEKGLDEPLISVRDPGGSAGGFDKENTLIRAILELVERDAYLTLHLTRSKPLKLDIEKIESDRLSEIIDRLKKYHLEYHIYDITNDLQIPVYMTLLIDRSSYGPAINVGLRSGLDFEESIIQSIEDACQNRFGVKAELIYNREMIGFIKPESIAGAKLRGLFWARKPTIKKIDYFLDILPLNSQKEFKIKKSPSQKLKWIINQLNKKGFQVWKKDITFETFREIGFCAFKVVIPGLQPMYHDEGDKKIIRNRILAVNRFFGNQTIRLNKNPHLFI